MLAVCAAAGAILASVPQAATGAAPEEPAAADAEKRLGKTVRVQLPITGETVERVRQFGRRAVERAKEQNRRLTLIFEFLVPEGREDFGRGSEFGAAYDMADFLSGPELAGVRTVAYVPRTIQGHAVLPAIACDEIVMPPDASFGKAGVDERAITESRKGIYREVANRRKTIPEEVVLWMLDPTRDVLVVDTDVSREYIAPGQLEELEKKRPIKSRQKLTDSIAAERGMLSGAEARPLNFVHYLASNRGEVANALGLPAEAMDEDFSLVAEWRAVQVRLGGPVNRQTVSQTERLITDAVDQQEANFVCLWIDSRGGSPAGSVELAGFLAALDPAKVRTVAYIPTQAHSDAALVALACDQVVMKPSAALGGAGAYRLSQEDIRRAVQSISDPEGPWKDHSWSLIAAMIDPDLQVYRCTRLDEVGYFCDEELSDRNDRLARRNVEPKWTKGREITSPGKPLSLDGSQAKEYGLATQTADNFAQFKEYFGLGDDPALVEPGWADFLIQALASPALAAILLIVAFVAMYAELNTPGIGVAGFISAVCFLLFFWSHFLGGTADWLEVILFLAGVCSILLEIFVIPGFGIFGLGGAAMVLVSLVLASQTFVLPRNAYELEELKQSLLTIVGAGVGIVVAVWLLRRRLPETALFHRLFLQPPVGEEAHQIERREMLLDLEDLLGKQGIATTRLRPGGKARFGDALVDVLTDGDAVDRGAQVEVVEVHGNRVIVRAV
jgi:membrane-bound ClpP family serine protease